jgi:hypothetical protein
LTESSTSERELPAAGFVPAPFWGDPEGPSQEPEASAELATSGSGHGMADGDADRGDTGDAVTEDADGSGQEASDEESDGEPDEDDEDAESAERNRFAELVEERVRRAHYAHHLTRPVFTPEESALAVLVERRAAVWVPTMTFVATVVSAVAAVVLATRLRSDPTDPSGNQLVVVTVTVCLLAAAFATLLRAEVHYDRLRPRGRVVRHDVADAYELVRDAPRRLVHHEASIDVLRRVADLLSTAELLVDALATYRAVGGTRVRAHPAYERILRMRAEVEAIEVMLAEQDSPEEQHRSAPPDLQDPPQRSLAGAGYVDRTPLPHPDQVADYAGLADLADSLSPTP